MGSGYRKIDSSCRAGKTFSLILVPIIITGKADAKNASVFSYFFVREAD
jgi:hypothetical protein